MTKQKMIRICGILAIVGGIINIIADLLLIVGPLPGNYGLEAMALHTPFKLTLAGSILGSAVGIPMWLFLLVPLYYALKPAGMKFAAPVVLLLGYTFVLSAVYHSAAGLYHAGYSAFFNVGPESKSVLEEMIARFELYAMRSLPVFYAIGLGLGSIWLIVAILSGKTLFRRWMAVFSPLLSMAIMFVSNQLPAPIGGYFAPYDGSLMFTIFFLITTIAVWNYQEEKQREVI